MPPSGKIGLDTPDRSGLGGFGDGLLVQRKHGAWMVHGATVLAGCVALAAMFTVG